MVQSEASARTCYKSSSLRDDMLLVSFSPTHFGAAQNSAQDLHHSFASSFSCVYYATRSKTKTVKAEFRSRKVLRSFDAALCNNQRAFLPNLLKPPVAQEL